MPGDRDKCCVTSHEFQIWNQNSRKKKRVEIPIRVSCYARVLFLLFKGNRRKRLFLCLFCVHVTQGCPLSRASFTSTEVCFLSNCLRICHRQIPDYNDYILPAWTRLCTVPIFLSLSLNVVRMCSALYRQFERKH